MNEIKGNSARAGRRRIYCSGAVLALAAVLGGCAGGPHCVDNDNYQRAQAFPALKAPPGLEVPEADSDFQIPEVTVSSGPVGSYDSAPPGANSDDAKARCLTTPPPIGESS